MALPGEGIAESVAATLMESGVLGAVVVLFALMLAGQQWFILHLLRQHRQDRAEWQRENREHHAARHESAIEVIRTMESFRGLLERVLDALSRRGV
ncbi:MAG: hypothetical protein AAF416_14320 [Pseudomonadota bacterium]